jgi:hypothetical protein
MSDFAEVKSVPQTPENAGVSASQTTENSPVESVGLMDLKPKSCRWPLTEAAPWLFCGHPKKRGAFCKEHGARAYLGKGGSSDATRS